MIANVALQGTLGRSKAQAHQHPCLGMACLHSNNWLSSLATLESQACRLPLRTLLASALSLMPTACYCRVPSLLLLLRQAEQALHSFASQQSVLRLLVGAARGSQPHTLLPGAERVACMPILPGTLVKLLSCMLPPWHYPWGPQQSAAILNHSLAFSMKASH